jgi:rSAM/selenodomain-associated transferase 2
VISVIVPLRGETAEAASRFESLTANSDVEILVADGNDNPDAADAFRAIGARILHGSGTRGARLGEAARSARGDTLLFLHADSRLEDGSLDALRHSIESGTAAGAFSLGYENAGPALRWIAAWANLRARWLRLPFCDQGIFCRRDAYERSGGFRDMAVCDDLDWVIRLRREPRFEILPQKTQTSPRRYESRGAFAQVLVNWKVLIGYFAGVSPEKLERWYQG